MAGANKYDSIINGSFDAIGAPPSYMSPAYNPADYASIYASPTSQPSYQSGMLNRGLPLSAVDRLPRGSAGIDPVGWTPPTVASVPLPRPRPWEAPTSMDMAAINAQPANGSLDQLLAYVKGMPDKPQTPALTAANGVATDKVSAAMRARPRGLFDLLFGPPKTGSGGLFGLLNQPRAGMPATSGGGGQTITAPGGGGAFIAPHGSPAEAAGNGPGALLPASMNNERWLTGY